MNWVVRSKRFAALFSLSSGLPLRLLVQRFAALSPYPAVCRFLSLSSGLPLCLLVQRFAALSVTSS